MGLTEALNAYHDYSSLCPACQRAAKAAGKRILNNCRAGHHAKARKADGVLLEGPPP